MRGELGVEHHPGDNALRSHRVVGAEPRCDLQRAERRQAVISPCGNAGPPARIGFMSWMQETVERPLWVRVAAGSALAAWVIALILLPYL
jgi:hypothetical protein